MRGQWGPASLLSSPPQYWYYKHSPPHLAFLHSFWESNSSPRGFLASTLLTEQPLRFHHLLYLLTGCSGTSFAPGQGWVGRAVETARDYSESILDSACRNRTERAWCSQVMETTLPPPAPHCPRLLPLPLSQLLFFYLPSSLSGGTTFPPEARNHPHAGLRGAAAPTTHTERKLNKHGPLSLRPWHPRPGKNQLLPPLHTLHSSHTTALPKLTAVCHPSSLHSFLPTGSGYSPVCVEWLGPGSRRTKPPAPSAS